MKISEHVRTTITQDGAVLMNIKRGSMLTLNPIGSIVWQRLNDGRTPAQIAVQLASEFGISQEQACADVNEFVEQLRAHQLIELEELSPSSFLSAKPTGLFCNLFGKRNSPPAQGRNSK
jgi:hypothetical protein